MKTLSQVIETYIKVDELPDYKDHVHPHHNYEIKITADIYLTSDFETFDATDIEIFDTDKVKSVRFDGLSFQDQILIKLYLRAYAEDNFDEFLRSKEENKLGGDQ